MVATEFEETKDFIKATQKIKDNLMREKVKKQILKIIENPEIGKPMMYERRGTREVYIKPFRLAYLYSVEENKITLVDLYHKRKQ